MQEIQGAAARHQGRRAAVATGLIIGSVARVAALCLTESFRFRRFTVATALLTLAACAVQPSQPNAVASGEITRSDGHVDVGSNVRRVLVRNSFGDVHVRRSRAPIVSYHAVVQRIDPVLPAAGVKVHAFDDRIEVEVSIEGVRLAGDEVWNPRRARLDLALAISDKLDLDVSTSFGSIDARGLLSSIRARSIDGKINLSTGGGIDARSERGDIGLVQRLREYEGGMRARTGGRISATVPFDAGYVVRAHSCRGFDLGGLAVPVALDGEGCQRIDHLFGGGNHVLDLWSTSGPVTVRDHALIGD